MISFGPTEEQELIRDTLRELLARHPRLEAGKGRSAGAGPSSGRRNG